MCSVNSNHVEHKHFSLLLVTCLCVVAMVQTIMIWIATFRMKYCFNNVITFL